MTVLPYPILLAGQRHIGESHIDQRDLSPAVCHQASLLAEVTEQELRVFVKTLQSQRVIPAEPIEQRGMDIGTVEIDRVETLVQNFACAKEIVCSPGCLLYTSPSPRD